MTLAINIDHAEKTYHGKVRALRGVALDVHAGEIFGLLGPNGAGKSTLVKILMTVIRPSRCQGRLLGEPIGHKPTLARVGYLPEHHRFPDYLNARQVLDFYGGMTGVPRRERRDRSARLLDLVGLAGWSGKKVGGFSKGMRQRLGIAQALINDPELVLLDEPTDGVDPVGRRDIREILKRIKDEGATVFLNSHLLSELEMVCDRVAILVQGVVAQQGTIDELTKDQARYEIQLAEPPDRAADLLRASAHQPEPDITADTLTLHTADPAAVQPVLARLVHAGATVRAVRPHRPSLEDLFMQAVTDPATGETLKPGAARNAPTERTKA